MGKGRKKRRPTGGAQLLQPIDRGMTKAQLRARAIADVKAGFHLEDFEHGPVTAASMASLVDRQLLTADKAQQHLERYGGTDSLYKVDLTKRPPVSIIEISLEIDL